MPELFFVPESSLATCDCSGCRRQRAIARGETPPTFCSWCDSEFTPTDDEPTFCSQQCRDYYNIADDDDYDDDAGNGYVHNYSYRPPLNFRKVENDADEKLFFGFELEIPTDHYSEFAERLASTYGENEQLLYCKEDGSIDGVEIVSHPMTHQFFRESFPFEMFGPRRKLTRWLRETPSEGYGLHVHVSREGFKGDAHILRWLLLIYRNQEAMAALARRTSQEWSSFRDDKRCIEKARNITRTSRRVYDYDQDRYVDSGEVSEYPGYDGERYVAVNAQNADTFELRLFRSTWTEQEFRAAIDFAHASVVYTRGLTAADVTRGNGLSFDRFREWLSDKPQYENLTRELERVLHPALLETPITLESEELACAF